jgi:hypothetical protein
MPMLAVVPQGRILALYACLKNLFVESVIPIVRIQ